MEQVKEIAYRPMSLEQDALEAVAALIETSAPELFAVMFGRNSIPVLAKFIQRSHNRYSHRYIYVAEVQAAENQGADCIVGIAILVPATAITDRTDDQTVLQPWQRLRQWLLERLILDRVLQHDYPADAFYLANLAVRSDYQNRGIGTQLLLQCIAAVPSSNSLFISVDIANPRAQRLYESLGFQVVADKTLRLLNRTIGSRVLVRPGSGPINSASGGSAETSLQPPTPPPQ